MKEDEDKIKKFGKTGQGLSEQENDVKFIANFRANICLIPIAPLDLATPWSTTISSLLVRACAGVDRCFTRGES